MVKKLFHKYLKFQIKTKIEQDDNNISYYNKLFILNTIRDMILE
jgi:hypothetical protein